MLDQWTVLKVVTGRLDGAGIPYMVTGSIAAGLYGQPRMTRDIDIVVELEGVDAGRFSAVVGEEFNLEPAHVRSAIARRSTFNAIHEDALVKVDFVVRKDDEYRITEFDRRRSVEVEGHRFWVVSPEDLVLSKLFWAKGSGSELQLRDVRGVLRLQGGALDWTYLEQWAVRLTVFDLLREVQQ